MGNRILIVDDDATFNSLLTDIFEQAGHTVVSENSPEAALKRADAEEFDLLITDHRMPEITGRDIFRHVREQKPMLPIIIVSGFLSNGNIRSLFEEGIDGVYIKPLNVFSLLQQSEKLIQQTQSGERGAHRRTLVEREGDFPASRLPFTFNAFPCQNSTAEKFARKLFDMRHFKSSLVLLGEPGTPFRNLCEDLMAFESEYTEHFEFVQPDALTEDHVMRVLNRSEAAGIGRVSFVLHEVKNLDDTLRDRLVTLLKREKPFGEPNVLSRLIFCCHQDIDAMFDAGVIDDRLYVLMGAAELRVPPLRAISDDIPVLAKRILADFARHRGLNQIPQLSPGAGEVLARMKWPGNYDELRDRLHNILGDEPRDVITASLFDTNVQEVDTPTLSEHDFVELLMVQKKQMITAIGAMTNEHPAKRNALLYGVEHITEPEESAASA